MKRKGFLFVVIAALVLGGFGLMACQSSSTPTDPNARVFTSSSDQGHTHTITIQRTEIDTPPAAGISRQTSANGHTHTFTMNEAQLLSVQGGTPVTVTTSDTSGHSHNFTISKWY